MNFRGVISKWPLHVSVNHLLTMLMLICIWLCVCKREWQWSYSNKCPVYMTFWFVLFVCLPPFLAMLLFSEKMCNTHCVVMMWLTGVSTLCSFVVSQPSEFIFASLTENNKLYIHISIRSWKRKWSVGAAMSLVCTFICLSDTFCLTDPALCAGFDLLF